VIVLDTHAWLWWCDAPKRLSRSAGVEIERAAAIGVSAMSCWELVMLERQNRLQFDRGVVAWIRQGLSRDGTVMLPITSDIAIRGGAIHAHVPDPADALIYATAIEHGAQLVSHDRRLHDLDPARLVW